MSKLTIALIDWLTFSIKGVSDPDWVIEHYLRMEPDLFQDQCFGRFGYQRSKIFGNIAIYYAPPEDRVADMGICVSMSGTGCRTFEAHTIYENPVGTPFMTLFSVLHIDEAVNVSRIDLSIDERDGLLDLGVIAHAVRENQVNSYIKRRLVYDGYNGNHHNGITVYFGAESSEFRIRIYDKAKEMFKPDQPEYNQHWVRLEIVMRGNSAKGCLNCLVNTDDLGALASGILNDKLAFIERDDENITRCTICQWWIDFVDSVVAIKLVSKEERQHKLEDTLAWVIHQIAPSLSLISDAYGYFQIRDILKIGTSKRTKQQIALLEDYRKVYRIKTK